MKESRLRRAAARSFSVRLAAASATPSCARRAASADADACEANLRSARRLDDLPALIGDARQVVESRHRVVERLRAEYDCERVGVVLLVEHPQVGGEMLLRRCERADALTTAAATAALAGRAD